MTSFLCYRVKKQGETNFRQDECLTEIEGLDYTWGYRYQVEVVEVDDLFSTCGKKQVLTRILSRTPVPKQSSFSIDADHLFLDPLIVYSGDGVFRFYNEVNFRCDAQAICDALLSVIDIQAIHQLSFHHSFEKQGELVLDSF